MGLTTKMTIDEVREFLASKNLILLDDEYHGSAQKVNCECKICNTPTTCVMKSRKTRKVWCKVCQSGSHQPLTIPVIAKRFAEKGFELTATEYIDDVTPLSYICICGNEDEMPYARFRKHPDGCKNCVEKGMTERSTKKFGAKHPQQSKAVRDKTKATCKERYDHENPFQVPEFQEKGKNTMVEKYGEENPMHVQEFRDKQEQTMIKNHGVPNPSLSKEICEKRDATNIKRYGAKNVMQNKEIFKRAQASGLKPKFYTLPSGRKIKYQGYENFCIDLLLETYNEDDFIVGNRDEIPVIKFPFEENICTFYPDCYIPSENRIIEVKSDYYWRKYEDRNRAKLIESYMQGYVIEFWVFDKKGNLNSIFTTEDN